MRPAVRHAILMDNIVWIISLHAIIHFVLTKITDVMEVASGIFYANFEFIFLENIFFKYRQ